MSRLIVGSCHKVFSIGTAVSDSPAMQASLAGSLPLLPTEKDRQRVVKFFNRFDGLRAEENAAVRQVALDSLSAVVQIYEQYPQFSQSSYVVKRLVDNMDVKFSRKLRDLFTQYRQQLTLDLTIGGQLILLSEMIAKELALKLDRVQYLKRVFSNTVTLNAEDQRQVDEAFLELDDYLGSFSNDYQEKLDMLESDCFAGTSIDSVLVLPQGFMFILKPGYAPEELFIGYE